MWCTCVHVWRCTTSVVNLCVCVCSDTCHNVFVHGYDNVRVSCAKTCFAPLFDGREFHLLSLLGQKKLSSPLLCSCSFQSMMTLSHLAVAVVILFYFMLSLLWLVLLPRWRVVDSCFMTLIFLCFLLLPFCHMLWIWVRCAAAEAIRGVQSD